MNPEYMESLPVVEEADPPSKPVDMPAYGPDGRVVPAPGRPRGKGNLELLAEAVQDLTLAAAAILDGMGSCPARDRAVDHSQQAAKKLARIIERMEEGKYL